MWKGDLMKAGISSDGQNIDIFGGKLTIAGTPVVGSVFGNAYFVDYRNGDDDHNGKTRNKALKTLSAAISLCSSNNNDVIFIDGDSTVVESAMVELTKNRVHIVRHKRIGKRRDLNLAFLICRSNIFNKIEIRSFKIIMKNFYHFLNCN